MTYNERLFKLQDQYGIARDPAVLDGMYQVLYRIARGMSAPYVGQGRGELDSADDIAHDAAAEIIKRFLENPKYQVYRCFKAVVRHALRDRCRPKRIIDQCVDRIDDIGKDHACA
jgi:hypothetical protein